MVYHTYLEHSGKRGRLTSGETLCAAVLHQVQVAGQGATHAAQLSQVGCIQFLQVTYLVCKSWIKYGLSLETHTEYNFIINMEICKEPTLRLKALNTHSITHVTYIQMEMLSAIKM